MMQFFISGSAILSLALHHAQQQSLYGSRRLHVYQLLQDVAHLYTRYTAAVHAFSQCSHYAMCLDLSDDNCKPCSVPYWQLCRHRYTWLLSSCEYKQYVGNTSTSILLAHREHVYTSSHSYARYYSYAREQILM